MCITEYNEAETLEILANEVRKEAALKQQQKTIRRMKEEGLPIQMIMKIMEVSEEYINSVV